MADRPEIDSESGEGDSAMSEAQTNAPATKTVMNGSHSAFSVAQTDGAGISATRPTRESVLQRLSEALLRRSLTKIDLSQRSLIPSDARLVKMALMQNVHLSVLKLGYNNLGDEGACTLAAGITIHKTLESLDLGFNNVGDQGCRAIASATAGSSLQTLYLAGNLIGEDGAVALADVIRTGCSLRRLYLTGNRLGADGVKAITEAIVEDELRQKSDERKDEENGVTKDDPYSKQISSGMRELFLGGTGLGTQGCQAVAVLLGKTTTLRVLSLANCNLGDEEISVLAASMKSNREKLTLEALQLSFNNITCKGLEYLMNAIWGSRTLRELRLDNNEIGDRGAQQVAAILPYVKTLELLDVGFNLIKSSGMRTLMKVIAETHHIVSLSVSGNAIDTPAAKAIAYALAYNRSLKSVFLVHCSIGHEGQRHISAGIVSNSRVCLRQLTGFNIGPVIVTLGFPGVIEHWTNEQVLNFIHMMWDQSRQEVEGPEEEEKEIDPLHFLPGNHNETRLKAPLEATVVVEVARKAFTKLVENGVDIFSRQPGHPYEPSFESPLASHEILIEAVKGSSLKSSERPPRPILKGLDRNGKETRSNGKPMPTNQARSFVAPPECSPKEEPPDPTRKRRIVEWLCKNIKHLNDLSQLPFNSGELWRLHQHYFTPVVNESGGNVVPSCIVSADPVARVVSSVPEVPRGISGAVTPSTQSSEDQMFVPISDPSIQSSPPVANSLPMLKRKVSYRFLGDAMLATNPRHDARGSQVHGASSVSKMIEEGPTGHSLPPKTKRARRNRTRISFVPRIKAKLDSYLDVCHEKALSTMRQLYYVEQALLSGRINPIDPQTTPRTHLCGILAYEAEMIIVDMI